MQGKLGLLAVGLAVTLGTSVVAFAQPKGKPSLAAIMKAANFGRGVTCKVLKPGDTVKEAKAFKNERTGDIVTKYEYRYAQAIECKRPDKVPGFPNAKRFFDGSANFSSLGGPWKWSQFNPWDRWLEGMPKPDAAALAKAIESDRSTVIRDFFLNKVTKFHSYGIKKGARVLWVETTTLKTEVAAVVDFKEPGQELSKKELVFNVEFQRDGEKGPWKVVTSKTKSETELSRSKPSPEEWKLLTSVVVQEMEQGAQAKLAALPKVEVPSLGSAREAQHFVYRILRESPREETEAYLRQLYAASRRLEGSTVLLRPDAEQELVKVLDAVFGGESSFKDQYCEHPMPKWDNTYGFENKERSAWTGIRVAAEGGEFQEGQKVNQQWRVSEIKVSMLKGDKLARMRSLSKDPCAVSLPKTSGDGSWHTADRVEAKRYNNWVPGELVEIKDGKGLVKYDQGSKEWHPPAELRAPGTAVDQAPAPGSSTANAAPSSAPAAAPFKVGDRVEGNYGGRGRWYKGTIKDINSSGDKARILYDDRSSEWLTFDKVRPLE